MKRLTIWLLLGMTLLSAGCNTMSGVGQDLEEAGDEIEEAAE